MRSLVENYNPKLIFWEEFRSFKDVEPFSSLYKKDKSPGKRISSMKMWAVSLAYDLNSDFYNMPNKFENIKKAMEANHRMKLNWDEINELKEAMYDMFLDQAERSLLEWEKRMQERDAFLKEQSWSFDIYDDSGRIIKGTAEQLDKMHSQTAKHFTEYEKIYKLVKELKLKENNANKKSNVQELDV